MNKNRAIILLFSLCLIPLHAYALDTSTESGKTQKNEREQSLQQKKAQEQGTAIEIKFGLDQVFLPILAELEKRDKTFKGCRVISKPMLPGDIGVSTARGGGDYDVIAGQIYEQQAKSNTGIPNQAKVKRYRNCMALYGAVAAQGHWNLLAMLPKGPIGPEDLKILARIAVEKTLATGFSPNIKTLFDMITTDKMPCRFAGTLDHYKCGMSTVDLSSQKLYIGSTEFYGEKFAGYVGEYKVSSTSTASAEQVQLQKRAWDMSKNTKQTVDAGKLLPPIH